MEKVGVAYGTSGTKAVQIQGKCGVAYAMNLRETYKFMPARIVPLKKSTEPSGIRKSTKEQKVSPTTANVIIDYSKDLGRFSPYLFGINTRVGYRGCCCRRLYLLHIRRVPPMVNLKTPMIRLIIALSDDGRRDCSYF